MIIKVQCPCGTKFQFEVAPVNGRMPVPIHCPTCNADDTELANALIQQQLSAAAPPAPAPAPVPIPPTPPPASGLRVAGLHRATPQPPAPAAPVPAAAPAEAAEGAQELCPKHKTEAAIDSCKVCGKPICLKCMEQFGYVCSVYCRQQATAKRMYIPVCPHQKAVVAGRSAALAKWISAGVALLAVLALGLWFWYAWFAREPKVVYSLPIPKADAASGRMFTRPDDFFELIGPGQLLSVKNKQVSLFDVAEQKQLWATALKGDNDYDFANPRVAATSNDVWIAFADRLMRFDRQTGSSKDVGIKDRIFNVSLRPDAIVVVAGVPGGQVNVSMISLPEGTVQTEDVSVVKEEKPSKPDKNAVAKTKPAAANAKANPVAVGRFKNLVAQTQTQPPPASASEPDADVAVLELAENLPFIAAGPNVVELKTKELEHKTIAHQAMKPKGKSVLEDSNLNASQGLEVAQEMMNDARRQETGGVEIEDVSRYQVTMHRLMEKGVADWTGEVVGPPQLFALQTVDVLVAGQGVYVFDKQNKKLWEAKLTFPVVHRFSEERPPCLETKDALYFADAGTLTRFDLANGNVRWRYNTVGISQIVSDERGGIYIVTTTAGPEQIQYSQEINLRDKIKKVVMKLDAATSKPLWRQESLGDEVMLSGKFLYAIKETRVMNALRLEEGPDRYYNLNLVDPGNGSIIWNYRKVNHPVMKTEAQRNWILVQMDDEMVVLKFFSL